jgi:O-antigen ligase
LLGLGADQFRVYSVQEAPVHNLYLLLWTEGGLPGLIGWLLFPLASIFVWAAARKADVSKYLTGAVFSTTFVFMAIAASNPHMYARYWTIGVLLTLGMAVAEWRRKTASGMAEPIENQISPLIQH